jgi:hypothetical protein
VACECGKRMFADEASALAAAAEQQQRLDGRFSAYRCPGRSCWHTTSGGYHPASLQSWCRIVAHVVERRQHVDLETLASHCAEIAAAGMIGEGWSWSKKRRRDFRNDIAGLVQLGLVAVAEGDVFVAVDRDGLNRVCQVGVYGLRAERGCVWAPVPDELEPILAGLRRAIQAAQDACVGHQLTQPTAIDHLEEA